VIPWVSKWSAHAEGRFSIFDVPTSLRPSRVCYSQLARDAEGFPRQFEQPQDRHPAPARSSRLSPREPPLEKRRPAHPPAGGNVSAARHRRPWHRHVARGPPLTTTLGG
jgi:hypothetical protein